MTDTPASAPWDRAAEEIERCMIELCEVCGRDCKDGPMDPTQEGRISRIAAIIERHFGEKETIVAASLRDRHSGVIVSTLKPGRHHHIFHALPYDSDMEQGFLTSTGRFVSREGAYCIALEARQIEAKPKSPYGENVLFTEDLW